MCVCCWSHYNVTLLDVTADICTAWHSESHLKLTIRCSVQNSPTKQPCCHTTMALNVLVKRKGGQKGRYLVSQALGPAAGLLGSQD